MKGLDKEKFLTAHLLFCIKGMASPNQVDLLQHFYKPIAESTAKSKTLNIPAEASLIFVWMMDNKFCPFLWCWSYQLQPTPGAETKFVSFVVVILAP